MVEDAVTTIMLALTGILTFVEISPIKWKPWSMIGKIVNRAVLDELKEIKQDHATSMRDVNAKITELRAYLDESEAKAARMRIQRFADEMYGDVRHSKEHFDLILMDITAYNKYCDAHEDFLNEKTEMAQRVIKVAYEKCLREKKFRV